MLTYKEIDNKIVSSLNEMIVFVFFACLFSMLLLVCRITIILVMG